MSGVLKSEVHLNTGEYTLSRRGPNRDLAILVLLVSACAIPFLGQPFHMDDNFYMDMARNAQVNPFFPNDTPYTFQGQSIPDMGSHSHPPLQTYCLAIVQHLVGEGSGKEWIYHSLALVNPILGVIAFYFICARYVERPLWPSLLLACSPLFLVMQHNLMTDIPMLAFWLAAIAAFLWASDLERTGLYAISSIFQVAAMFTSYQSVALTPLLAFYQLRHRRGAKGWLSLIPAPMFMMVWLTVNYFHYHRIVLGDTLEFVKSRDPLAPHALGTKLLATMEYQGWLIIFPFFILYVFARGLKGRALGLVTLSAIWLVQLCAPNYRLIDKAVFVIGLTAGVFASFGMAAISWKAILKSRRSIKHVAVEDQFLGLWYFGVLAYCLFFLTEGSARYILPLTPPVILCYFRQLETSEIVEYRLPPRLLGSAMLASGSLVTCLIWGLALSQADQEFAQMYPRAANDFSRISGKLESYLIGEWGFRYYFGRVGARELPADESLVHGASFLVYPKLALPHDVPAGLRSMTMPFSNLSYRPKTALRLLDWQTPAGFYSSGWGLIPFAISRSALEEIEIRQVNFMVERLPWARIQCSSATKPWPGYLPIEGRAALGILTKPGTRIAYPWSVGEQLSLKLECGVLEGSYAEGANTAFTFEIRQLDADGGVLSGFHRTIHPGVKIEDRRWLPVQLGLEDMAEGTLEFSYSCDAKRDEGTGAFAQSFLRRPE